MSTFIRMRRETANVFSYLIFYFIYYKIEREVGNAKVHNASVGQCTNTLHKQTQQAPGSVCSVSATGRRDDTRRALWQGRKDRSDRELTCSFLKGFCHFTYYF